MIEFHNQTDFSLHDKEEVSNWLNEIADKHGFIIGDVGYIFCDDQYLVELNQKFLQHDTLTDIITFDDSLDKEINAEIYVSIDRVRDNANEFSTSFTDELHRVMVHGILHCIGFEDKGENERALMRERENESLRQRDFV